MRRRGLALAAAVLVLGAAPAGAQQLGDVLRQIAPGLVGPAPDDRNANGVPDDQERRAYRDRDRDGIPDHVERRAEREGWRDDRRAYREEERRLADRERRLEERRRELERERRELERDRRW